MKEIARRDGAGNVRVLGSVARDTDAAARACGQRVALSQSDIDLLVHFLGELYGQTLRSLAGLADGHFHSSRHQGGRGHARHSARGCTRRGSRHRDRALAEAILTKLDNPSQVASIRYVPAPCSNRRPAMST